MGERERKITIARADLAAGFHLLPIHLRDGLERFIIQGGPVGSFLTAVLDNDLREAVSRADDDSLKALKPILQFLYGFAPAGCHGSPKNRLAWQARGGVAGGAGDDRA